MDPARWRTIELLVEQALARPAEARRAFISEACGSDEQLVAEVETLLAELEAEPDFLEPKHDQSTVATDRPEVGGYRILRRLGAGGMGEVWLATPEGAEDPAQVAIKVIRHGLVSDNIARRFELERQILAGLRHPGIAALLEATRTADGRPCFVLEYVPGVPITAWADLHRHSLPRRLELFLAVCDAVDHAHRSLIVHRDLKPANILVTEAGDTKLLDFGIGKMLGDATGFGSAVDTSTGDRLLTLDYAAPEQLRGEVITTATDVHALGVLLYELLTGIHPFRKDGDTPGQVETAILDRIPDRPAAVVRSAPQSGPVADSDAKARAHARATSGPDALARRLSGDLDNIALMALRKEPERRYPSVAALADDIRRHRHGLPVRARPDTLSYRAAKFVRRHAGSVALAVITTIALIATTATAVLESRRATRATATARAERDEAIAVRSFLMETYGATGADDEVGASESVQQLVDRQAARIEREYHNQPLLAARLHEVVADAYDRLGLPARAAPMARRALELRSTHQRANHPDVAASHALLGWVLHQSGSQDSAEVHLRLALGIQRERTPIDSGPLARVLNDLGVVLNARGEWTEARDILTEALSIRRAHGGDSSLAVGITANNLAAAHYYLEDLQAAHRVQAVALAALEASVGPDHQRSVIALGNLAAFRLAEGDVAGAETDYRRLLAIQTRLQGSDHPVTMRVATSLAAALLRREGTSRPAALAEAATLAEAALAVQQRQPGQGLPQMVVTLERLAAIRLAQGDTTAAAPLLRRALEGMVALRGADHPQVAAFRTRWCGPRTGC